jgi:hypothetical protein
VLDGLRLPTKVETAYERWDCETLTAPFVTNSATGSGDGRLRSLASREHPVAVTVHDCSSARKCLHDPPRRSRTAHSRSRSRSRRLKQAVVQDRASWIPPNPLVRQVGAFEKREVVVDARDRPAALPPARASSPS